jgi:hypothetical protein
MVILWHFLYIPKVHEAREGQVDKRNVGLSLIFKGQQHEICCLLLYQTALSVLVGHPLVWFWFLFRIPRVIWISMWVSCFSDSIDAESEVSLIVLIVIQQSLKFHWCIDKIALRLCVLFKGYTCTYVLQQPLEKCILGISSLSGSMDVNIFLSSFKGRIYSMKTYCRLGTTHST